MIAGPCEISKGRVLCEKLFGKSALLESRSPVLSLRFFFPPLVSLTFYSKDYKVDLTAMLVECL